jgi:hypothetical protein
MQNIFRLFRKKPENTVSLVGKWKLVRSEGAVDAGAEGVSIVFTNDGKLIYTIHEVNKDQIMNLTYEILGNKLITDQPSHPRKERTEFSVEPNGQLLLKYPGAKTWFERVNE